MTYIPSTIKCFWCGGKATLTLYTTETRVEYACNVCEGTTIATRFGKYKPKVFTKYEYIDCVPINKYKYVDNFDTKKYVNNNFD